MTGTFVLLFALIVFSILGWGMANRPRVLQFPFLLAAVAAGWMLPQMVGLIGNPILPSHGLLKTTIMAMLCLIAAWVGYSVNDRPANIFWYSFDRQRLSWCAILLSAIGWYFAYLIELHAPGMSTQWTGRITIYAFFSSLTAFGMAIALLLAINRPSLLPLLTVSLNLIFYLDRIIIKGRRASMVELALMLVLALWFQRRWLPSRLLIFGALVVSALLINSIGDYRSRMLQEDGWTWSGAGPGELLDVDFVGNFKKIWQGDADNFEVTNAVMSIEAVDRTMSLDYGFSLWRSVVHAYVPGQLVGADLKQKLMTELAPFTNATDTTHEEFRFRSHTGTTMTGLTDSFASFWYFGFIKFGLIGFIMSRWYVAAMQGSVVAQIVVMLAITPSLHALTHSTNLFFTFFIQLAVFLLPVLIFARIRRPAASVLLTG